ncbi:MAG: alpha/beta hydrolase [Pseudomonadota bacterium]
MTQSSFLTTLQGRRIAYRKIEGTGPGLVFLGGFKSDMQGVKATHLEDWAGARGRTFVRFDYSGHGESSEDFLDGSVADWAEDAHQVITRLTEGPQILIGSSMGGWISLLMSKRMPERIAGLVTIAAAPDFTEDMYWAGFTDAQRTRLLDEGRIAVPSEYGAPYVITRRLIEEGRRTLVLRDPLHLPFPVRFLQGTCDEDVDISVALRLLGHATGPDIRLICLKDADHRFSSEDGLRLIEDAIANVLERIG